MSRHYSFQLPYEISSFYVSLGIPRLKSAGIFENLPEYLQHRLEKASSEGSSYSLSERDCNAIEDDTWEQLVKMLGLDE